MGSSKSKLTPDLITVKVYPNEEHSSIYSAVMKGESFSWLMGGTIAFVVGVAAKILENYPFHNMYFKYNEQHIPDLLWLNGAGCVVYSLLDIGEKSLLGELHNSTSGE